MVSDRTLETTFGMRPHAVALWGDAIRAVSTMVTCLVLAGLTVVYTQTVKNTVTIRHLQDFGVFYESARMARSGVDLYGEAELKEADPRLDGGRSRQADTRRHWNMNPPHFHLLIWPFTFLDPTRAFAVWLVVSVAALIGSLALVSRNLRLHGWPVFVLCAMVAASASMFATLMTGQVGLVLLVPFTLAWLRARQKRDAEAGAWIGVCASVKPFLLLFVLYFALVRRARAVRMASLTVVAMFAAGLAVYGLQAHRAWFGQLSSVTWAEHYMNASVLGLVERTLSTSEWQQLPIVDWPWLVGPIWVVLVGALGVAALWRVRSIPNVDRQFLLVTLTALLLSPLGWIYYLWFLLPPLAASLSAGEVAGTAWRRGLLGVGLAGLLVPPPLPWMSLRWAHGLGTATVGSIYGWALIALWVLTWSEPANRLRTSADTTE